MQQQDIIKNQNVPNFQPNYQQMYNINAGLFGLRQPANYSYKPPNSDRYDFYGDFLNQKGINNFNSLPRYKSNYIHIDTRTLQKKTKSINENYIQLDTNPIEYKLFSNKIKVYYENHNLSVTDKVSIIGVPYVIKIYKTYTGASPIFFIDSSTNNYLTFDIPHNLPEFDVNLNKFNPIGLEVEIQGIQGTNGFIGNIPLNTINKTHQIIIDDTDNNPLVTYNSGRFYIKLIDNYDDGVSTSFVPDSTDVYNFTVIFKYYAGIPINLINSEYPLSPDNLQGYHIITETTPNSFTFELNKTANFFVTTSNVITYGMSDVCVAKVLEVIAGYPNLNNYSIIIGKVLLNVVIARLISTEFPNTEKNVKDCPINSTNNKLYWQNLEDGDYLYSITIDNGVYSQEELSKYITDAIYNVEKVVTQTGYNNKNYIECTIDYNLNKSTFKGYKEAELYEPFYNIVDVSTATRVIYDIYINHPSHNLKVGEYITIKDAISDTDIPDYIFNKKHLIKEIIDADKYRIRVEHFNKLSPAATNTKGGTAVRILADCKFRLLFDKDDTIGELLAFRKVGEDYSITPYNNVITNKDLYEIDLLEPEDYCYDDGPIIQNDNLLNSDKYILMACNQLNHISSNGPIKSFFAKILTTNDYNKTMYNTFVDAPFYSHDPIAEISELEFTFYDKNGELYNFNRMNHSFTIELVTLEEIPEGTNHMSNYSKVN